MALHDHSRGAIPGLPPSLNDRYRQMRRVTLIGSALDLTLGVLKLLTGWLANSQALIADGVHSLSDLVTDALVLFAAKHAHREADREHPYGHGRIETLATVGLGVALAAVAGGIGYAALVRLAQPEHLVRPGAWALVVALLSVASKEWIYRYTMVYARQLRSNLLRANAWHSRTDAISSVVVIVGVGASMAGFTYLDAVAAVVVALMIAKIGWDLVRGSVQELIDTGLDEEQLKRIRELILSVDGVAELHQLRTRQMGGKTLADVHIILSNPRVSVSEGHQLSETVRAELLGADEDITDVTVHIDVEDDERGLTGSPLPLRREMLERLGRHWESVDAAEHIERVDLHYLDGKVHVEVVLPMGIAQNEAEREALRAAFGNALSPDEIVAGVRLLFD